jgi:hypothetical protein
MAKEGGTGRQCHATDALEDVASRAGADAQAIGTWFGRANRAVASGVSAMATSGAEGSVGMADGRAHAGRIINRDEEP